MSKFIQNFSFLSSTELFHLSRLISRYKLTSLSQIKLSFIVRL